MPRGRNMAYQSSQVLDDLTVVSFKHSVTRRVTCNNVRLWYLVVFAHRLKDLVIKFRAIV